MIVVKYKFNPSTYADLLPVFSGGFSYTKSDTTNSDGTITRTIESSSLPTRITFGEYVVNDRCKSLLEILDMNTSNLTTTSDLFRGCINLTSVTCSWNTSKVTNMSSMFSSCNSLNSLDVSNFNTSQVTDMSGMFINCNSLTQLNVSKWNTSNVTNMSSMFQNCTSLTSLDVSNWNTSKVTNISNIFNKCSLFTSLNVSKWDTSKVTNMTGVFFDCRALTSLDLSNWDVSQVTNMYCMFQNCSSLTSLDLNNWNTSKLTDITSTFQYCTSLTQLSISGWNISKVTYMNNLFLNCSSLTSLDISTWNTSKAIRMNGIFQSCTSLTSLDLSNWDTSQANDMSKMFSGCNSLTSLNISRWNVSKVTNMSYMFQNCKSLTSLNINNWNMSKVTNISNMFNNCTSLVSVDINGWNTSRVTDMSSIFYYCTSLISVDISNWDTSRVTNMRDVFSGCTSIVSINMSNCNTFKVTSYRGIFYNCRQLTTLDISNFDISDGSDIYAMFSECRNLYKVNLKYANQSTVSKIHENLLDRSSTTKGYILSSVDLTSNKNWQIIKSSHNKFYLPQPLNKIGDVKDRLYWDENKGHYCIDQNAPKIYLHTLDWILGQGTNLPEDEVAYQIGNFCQDNNITKPSFNVSTMKQIIKCNVPSLSGSIADVGEGDTFVYHGSGNIYFKTKKTNIVNDSPIPYLKEKGYFIIVTRPTPNIIDLPYLNQKLTFDSYNPSTTIDIPNRPLKASKTYLDAPISRYRYIGLQPNTQYHVQFDCKGDNGIKVNLGGTETTFTPTSEWTRKNLTITTPSELVNDKLSISNVGITSNNKIDNVMLFSEVIAQEPDYIDGIQNIGELQDNETYKIDILSTNGVKNLVNTNPNNWVVKDSDSVIIKSSIKVNEGKTYTVFNSTGQWVAVYESDRNGNQYNLIGQDNTGNWSFVATSEYIKVSLWNISHISDKLSQPHNMNVRIFEGYNDYGYNGYEERKLSTQSILLPQPLNKKGDIKDKFYWDDNKGHYCIEQNVEDYIITKDSPFIYRGYKSLNVYAVLDKEVLGYDLTNKISLLGIKQYSQFPYQADELGYYINNETGEIEFVIHKLKVTNSLEGILSKLFEVQEEFNFMYGKTTPNIIDLPHLNEKYSLDTYMPTTYLECTNSPMQPSRILLESDTVRYKPSALETDTDYTVQFECKEKSDKKVKLNLGGAEKEVDVEVGLNHVSITTPSEIDTSLYKDRLFLSGVGNKVADVIVNKGEMNQYPEYFDGVQSTGELQDDGTYKIDIETYSSGGDNLLSYSNFVSGHLLNGNVVSPDATVTHTETSLICNNNGINWRGCSSNYIEIDSKKNYFYEYTTSVTNPNTWYSNVSFYDESKMYISNITTSGWIDIPSNAKYLKVCYQMGTGDSFTVSNMRLFTPTTFKVSTHTNSPLAKRDKLYWNKSNKRYEIDRSGSVEVPTVEGDVVDLPRLYQREDTNFSASTGNIKPSKIKLDYNDLD